VRRAIPPVEASGAALAIWPASLWLDYGRAWRRLAEGRLAEACELYERMETLGARVGLGEPCAVPWAGHAAAAYVRSGRTADACRVIGWLEDRVVSLPCRWPRIAAASGRALLAEAAGDQARADDLFHQAMSLHHEVDLPLERLQTLLEYGRFLRRSGQLQRARPLLAEALRLSEAAGAEWLAGQAREELRVAGGRRRQHSDPRRLTAREQRVAALAADGATNTEIARTLFISVSTVETHLEHVFAKLAIRSRRELRAGLASPDLGRAEP
jgi:DNA-binding CsgD family transcriptional regulator